MVAQQFGPADAQTQTLPVVPAAPPNDPLGWRDVRLSREAVVEGDEALPVSRTRLMMVFGVLAVTALTTVVALTRGSEHPAGPATVGSAFGDGPSFGSTPQRAPIEAPPPPRPSAEHPGPTRPSADGASRVAPAREAADRVTRSPARVSVSPVAPRPGG
ncbi:hypothetical protein, partial [Luedemannella flava]|uniref:hypothetical protein n=1 Tax=Luedemannella flava TaxID=349316 RepID=UPI003CD0B7FA